MGGLIGDMMLAHHKEAGTGDCTLLALLGPLILSFWPPLFSLLLTPSSLDHEVPTSFLPSSSLAAFR